MHLKKMAKSKTKLYNVTKGKFKKMTTKCKIIFLYLFS